MKEDRAKIWDGYLNSGGISHKIVRHMFLSYSRYAEVDYIIKYFIDNKISLNFPILDYGCGVGDYGIQLLRSGAKEVYFYDFPRAVNFVNYRLDLEKLGGHIINADINKLDLNIYNLIIFGEVLEHLEDPYNILVSSLNSKYIFTSSYPYRNDDPEDPYWANHDHSGDARKQMPECRKLLERYYNFIKFEGELRLWFKK